MKTISMLFYLLNIVFMLKYVRAVICPIGFFDSNGVWTKWAPTWYTCISATEWTTWYNRILNNSTKLWEFWPYGQFYSIQIDMCLDWRGSWREQWGYQDMCFKWPTSMMFDLTLLTWVSNCTSTQIYINDPAMKNIPICRDTVYYVDPDGIEPIELGTK